MIRLTCLDCDTRSGDGVFRDAREAEAAGWSDVCPLSATVTNGPAGWWDYRGFCPACAAELDALVGDCGEVIEGLSRLWRGNEP